MQQSGSEEAGGGWAMPLIILDPRTGVRVALTASIKQASEQRARRWVLRELDRLADQQIQPAKRSP